MTQFDALLGTDFDGRLTNDPEDVIYDGLDNPAHRERVPGLVELMDDAAAPERERFLACVALTTWGEEAGYRAVIEAAAAPGKAPWYDILIDRKFSVDNTFAQLAVAVADSDDIAPEKGTADRRTAAFRALVGIADREYFDDKLGEILDRDTVTAALGDIRDVVERGVALLSVEKPARFDLATQLVDLAAAVATVDGAQAVELATTVLSAAAHHRPLVHALTIVHRVQGPEGEQFGEYVMAVGDEDVREQAKRALEARRN
ncbi:hypothetical protein [Streptomyces xinghaiensis]|uniref:hypothetical protein n=1 Tax=Streptomyces xinghaiensis TaxID=1038928 RepID=UPI002E0F4FAD|nr:hypothetical protein OG463_08460 [Streptomyces xinghaiensis]